LESLFIAPLRAVDDQLYFGANLPLIVSHHSACGMETEMKAIRVHEFGGPEVLELEDVATPKPSAGQA
jgi:hypothetical protein